MPSTATSRPVAPPPLPMRRRSCRPSTARRWPHYCSAYGPSWWVLLLKVGVLGTKNSPRSTARVKLLSKGRFGAWLFSVFLNGFHDVSDDEVGEICYVTCFWLIFFKISKAWGAWWHRTANLLLRGCRVVASFQKRFQVQKLFSQVISNWVQLVYPCRSNPQSGDEWMQIYKVRFWWSMP